MNKNMNKYWSEYKWSNVNAMIKNMRRKPQTNQELFQGKFVVITGATSGIGYHTARKYASMGAQILMINRNRDKSESVRNEIEKEFGTVVEYFIADLSFLSEILKVAQHLFSQERPIDVLIHNAGVHLQTRKENPFGLEENFAVHYLCPLLITKALIPKYQKDLTGRIILVGSEAYRFAAWGLDLDDLQWRKRRYTGISAYGAGKLAQLQFMHILSAELAACRVMINAMHPGMVRTQTGRDNSKLYKWYKRNIIDRLSESADVSAEALYYLGTAPELASTTDTFFHLTTPEELTPPAQDLEAAAALLERTKEFLAHEGISL